MKTKVAVTTLITLLALAPVVATGSPPLYIVTELKGPGGASAYAEGINNLGHVVGGSQQHAILWRDGLTIDLGQYQTRSTAARDINEQGQICGTYYDGYLYGCYWDGQWSAIGAGNGYATAINNQGVVAGFGADEAYVWSPSAGLTRLGTMGYQGSYVGGINNIGQVVGWTSSGATSFIWDAGVMQEITGTEIDFANDINDVGMIVGRCSSYDHGYMTDGLGNDTWLYMENPEAINIHNQVVGWTEFAYPTGERARLWIDGAGHNLEDLIVNESGWVLRRAMDINDSGQIVGSGWNPAGDSVGFLLTIVPEPTTLALFGAAGGIVLKRRRRQEPKG